MSAIIRIEPLVQLRIQRSLPNTKRLQQICKKTRLAMSQVTQFELTAKTQFSQSVPEAAGRQSSQFRGL
jgi:hypothetical protein